MPNLRSIIRPTVAVVAFLALTPAGLAREPGQPDPLFQSDEILEIHITAPISTLMSERSDDAYLPATISWTEPDGRSVEVDIGLRARGNYRRNKDTCRFPPIRLNFKKADVEDTLFHKQDALKLVTHCKDNSSRYEQLVLREYLIYRMANALTDRSYRARLLGVRYTDTESDKDDRVTLGIVIEHKDRFAKRTGLEELEIPRTRLAALDPAYTNLMSVFNFMIGNTDYSPIAGPDGENCCHNANLFTAEGGPIYPVPYDFDMSGMVSAPYATPNPRFNLRTVRQRLYRGHCANNSHLPATLQVFRDQRDSLYALIDNEVLLTSSTAKSMRKYLDSFYDIIDDSRGVDRYIIRECRG